MLSSKSSSATRRDRKTAPASPPPKPFARLGLALRLRQQRPDKQQFRDETKRLSPLRLSSGWATGQMSVPIELPNCKNLVAVYQDLLSKSEKILWNSSEEEIGAGRGPLRRRRRDEAAETGRCRPVASCTGVRQ